MRFKKGDVVITIRDCESMFFKTGSRYVIHEIHDRGVYVEKIKSEEYMWLGYNEFKLDNSSVIKERLNVK